MVLQNMLLACLPLALALMPRVVPIPVARSRAIIEEQSRRAMSGERKRALVWSHRTYTDLPPDVGSVAVVRGDAVCAVALLERGGGEVVLRDVAVFDNSSGTVLLKGLHTVLGTSLCAGRTLQPRWRVARAFFA